MIEQTIRQFIRFLELILVISVFSYFGFLYYELYNSLSLVSLLIYSYILTLSLFYYCSLLKKSPGSLLDYNGLEIRGICQKCNRLRSNRTFHCDSCDKCYYKRDHHCPWLGKCVAQDNYREYYFFILFMVIFQCMSLFRTNLFVETVFFTNMLTGVLFIFFLWINFLLCIDKTSIEYYKSFNELSFIKCKSLWTKLSKDNYFTKICGNLYGGDKGSLWLVFFPFLYKSLYVVEGETAD